MNRPFHIWGAFKIYAHLITHLDLGVCRHVDTMENWIAPRTEIYIARQTTMDPLTILTLRVFIIPPLWSGNLIVKNIIAILTPSIFHRNPIVPQPIIATPEIPILESLFRDLTHPLLLQISFDPTIRTEVI